MESVGEDRALMRSFSWELEQRINKDTSSSDLGCIVVEERRQYDERIAATAPWRKLFEEWNLDEQSDMHPELKMLKVEAANLAEAWKTFQLEVPEESRADFRECDPTPNGLVKMVETAATAWHAKRAKSKFGKFMKAFHSICGTLDTHSTILTMLPQGNEYVSLFSGALISIITASANHEQIAKDLAKALTDIGSNISACQVELQLYPTEVMYEEINKLYAHVFLFVRGVMSWYLKRSFRRMLDSFNEKFFRDFQDEIDNIKRISEGIRHRAQQGLMAESKTIRVGVEDIQSDVAVMHSDFRIGLRGLERSQAEQAYALKKLYQIQAQEIQDRKELEQERERVKRLESVIYQLSTHFNVLAIQQPNPLDSIRSIEPPTAPLMLMSAFSQNILSNTSGFVHDENVTRQLLNQPLSWNRDQVLLDSRALEDLFNRERVRPSTDASLPLMLDTRTISRIKEWIESSSARLLYITDSSRLNSVVTPMDAKLIQFAESSKIPVISYFCELNRDDEDADNLTREMKQLAALLYALVRQMIELLEIQFTSSSNFSASCFSSLSYSTWKEALYLFNELAELMPPLLFVVIDGFEWTDDFSTESSIKDLLSALQRKNFKVLISSGQRSRVLLSVLEPEETWLLDSVAPKSKRIWNMDQSTFAA